MAPREFSHLSSILQLEEVILGVVIVAVNAEDSVEALAEKVVGTEEVSVVDEAAVSAIEVVFVVDEVAVMNSEVEEVERREGVVDAVGSVVESVS